MVRKDIPEHLSDPNSTVRKIAEQARLEDEKGVRPVEVAETLDVKKETVGLYMRKLYRAGFLMRVPGEGRATYYKTTPEYNDFLQIEKVIERKKSEIEELEAKRDKFLKGDIEDIREEVEEV